MIITYPAGSIIIRQGEPGGDKMYIIESGTVEVSLEVKGGEIIPITKLGQGEFFGEMSLFDEKIRSATITAVTDVTLEVIEKKQIPYRLEKTPAWFQKLFKKLIERVRYSNFAIIHQTETQSELFGRERLQAAIEVAGAAAHEINQPLTILIGNCELIQKEENIEEIKQYTEKIIEATLRISKIISQMQIIHKYVTKPYPGSTSILDLEKATENSE